MDALNFHKFKSHFQTVKLRDTKRTNHSFVNYTQATEACHTDTTPTSHIETPTHIETRTHNQCGDTIEKSQTPYDGCINVRNMLSIEEVK